MRDLQCGIVAFDKTLFSSIPVRHCPKVRRISDSPRSILHINSSYILAIAKPGEILALFSVRKAQGTFLPHIECI